MSIYVLQCKINKYYVGKTDNFEIRMKNHLDGNGSAWTKKYKPINLIGWYDGTKHSEDEITLKYMEKYGIENVRGGAFCKVKLHQYQTKTLNDMINSKNDTCFNCGLKGHFINNCPNKKQNKVQSDILCTRCGRNTHLIDKCYARTHISGYYISSKLKDETQINEQDGRTYPDKFEKQDNLIKDEIDSLINVELELKDLEINLVKQLLKENSNSNQKHEINHLASIDIEVTESDLIKKIETLNDNIDLVNKNIDNQKTIKHQKKPSVIESIGKFFTNLFK